MATYAAHEWLIFANTIVGTGAAAVVVTAVCKRCGEYRSSLAPTEAKGQIDLTGECNVEGEEVQGAFR